MNTKKIEAGHGTFQAEFARRVEDIKVRAEKAGTSITALCQATGIARATPDRWAARAPKTVVLIDKLELALKEAEQQAAGQ